LYPALILGIAGIVYYLKFSQKKPQWLIAISVILFVLSITGFCLRSTNSKGGDKPRRTEAVKSKSKDNNVPKDSLEILKARSEKLDEANARINKLESEKAELEKNARQPLDPPLVTAPPKRSDKPKRVYREKKDCTNRHIVKTVIKHQKKATQIMECDCKKYYAPIICEQMFGKE
jgi:hypothetical protein